MKRILLLSLILIPALAMSQGWKNSNILRGTEDVSLLSSTTDTENNTIIFGFFNGSLLPSGIPQVDSRGGRDYFLAKYDSESNLIWIKGLGGSGNEFFAGESCTCVDDNIYVTGSFQGDFYYTDVDFLTSSGNHDIFLAKYDTDGNNIWCTNIGAGANAQRSTSLKVDDQANILVGGYYTDSIQIGSDTTLYTNAFKDYFYAKFKSDNGKLIWVKALKSIDNNFSGFIYSFDAADDHYIISGVFADSVDIGIDTLVSETAIQYDTHIFKTDTAGNILWVRKIYGTYYDYSYTSTLDPDNNIYVTGYYNSSKINFDSTDTEIVTITDPHGDYDFYIAKYSTDGVLQWARVNGGAGEDRLRHSNFFSDKLWVTGYFAGELEWGAQTLTADGGATDTDMFYGSIDPDGNYTGATQYKGRNNSTEYGRAVFSDSQSLYAVLRTNSDLFVAGDSTYLNPNEFFTVVIGAVGCLPISMSATPVNISGCYGDSTGLISIIASEGFGGFKYSIGEEYPYQAGALFNQLPAGDYEVSVIDANNCYEGPLTVSITEPAEIIISGIDSTDVLCFGESTGSITVNASGGTGTLMFSTDGGTTYTSNVGTAETVAKGVYTLAVKDGNDCLVEDAGTATINEPEQLLLTNVSQSDPLCFGENGSIELSAIGGSGAYSYSVDGGTTGQAETTFAVAAGDYNTAVTDENDCLASGDMVSISEPEELEISLISSTDVIVIDAIVGEISVEATGGTSPYSYTLTPGDVIQADNGIFTNLEPATYSISVTDANNCGPATLADIIILGEDSKFSAAQGLVYPNPTNGILNIELLSDKAEVTIEVFSIDGRKVHTSIAYASGGVVKTTLDLSSADKGMYMLRIDNRVLTNTIVVQ